MGKMARMLFLGLSIAATSAAAEPTFESHWQDGRAELDGYRYTITRYGEVRPGEAVLIFVTEPWSESQRVKVNDPALAPGDTFEALKLNLVRDFTTGIYDYNTMVSVFTRTGDFSPVEQSLSSAEWCGHVYAKQRFQGDEVREDLWSYFQGETGTRTLDGRRDGVTEDQLPILLRGLRGDYLAPGETRTVPFLQGLLYLRLTHRAADWTTAEIARSRNPETVEVPAGRFETLLYTVRVAAGGREGRYWVEAAHPHRLIRWSWTIPGGSGRVLEASESGELAGTVRGAYWQENRLGDEAMRTRLGLAPGPARPKEP